MKQKTIVLSALAVAATVSIAMANSRSLGYVYCTAYELIDGGDEGILTITLAYNREYYPETYYGHCTHVVLATLSPYPTDAYTTYGYIKTTPPGAPCPDFGTCPRIKAYSEF